MNENGINVTGDNCDQFEDLSVKFLTGDITADEMKLFENLMEDHTDYSILFQEYKKAWFASGMYQSDRVNNETYKSWNRLEAKLNFNEEPKPGKYRIGKVIRIAAVWLILISVSSIITWILTKNTSVPSAGNFCEMNTPMGSRSHLILTDGSEVWLNAGTTIRYPESFSKEQRNVYLSGEAFFMVKANTNWPFIVHTSDVQVKALGTEFNVKAYPTDKAIVTTLVKGIVKLENVSGYQHNFQYTLKPNEKFTYTKSVVHKSNPANIPATVKPKAVVAAVSETLPQVQINDHVNTMLFTSWKDKRWIIEGEQLTNLAVLLERRFGTPIHVLTGELDQYKFNGTIENETLEQVLKYISLTTPVTYTIKKGYVELTINEKLKDKYGKFLRKKP